MSMRLRRGRPYASSPAVDMLCLILSNFGVHIGGPNRARVIAATRGCPGGRRCASARICFVRRNSPRLDSARLENTLRKTTNGSREKRDEIRHLLRAAIAAPVASRRRAQALSGCADATGDRGPLRLRPCLGGRASFSGGIFAFAVAGIVSRGRSEERRVGKECRS